MQYINNLQLLDALNLRDLTDPAQGKHAMQNILDDVTAALTNTWGSSLKMVRTSPLVTVDDNYQMLGYDPADVTLSEKYTRYVSSTVMLRSHTSSGISPVLREYRTAGLPEDELVVIPGLVYRRDVVDRTHVGEPHQVDLWRISKNRLTTDDLLEMVSVLVNAVLPGAKWRTTPVEHSYTSDGLQIDVELDGQWLELAECGLVAETVLSRAGLEPHECSGLALGMGLDRALMLRKNIPDIRYLRSREPRVQEQMNDLLPWRPVSMMPPARRDISIVIDSQTDDETLGDKAREALGDKVEDIESIVIKTRTPYSQLPTNAQERLGIKPGQDNALVRIILRPVDKTLTGEEITQLRNSIYDAVHIGPNKEY